MSAELKNMNDEEKKLEIDKLLDNNTELYKKFINSPFSDERDKNGHKVSYCVPPPGIIRTLIDAYSMYYPEKNEETE